METAVVFEEILQSSGENRLETTMGQIRKYPYFEIAHIAKAVFDKNNIQAKQNAALFTQNNLWLQFLLENNIKEAETGMVINETLEPEHQEANIINTTEPVLIEKEATDIVNPENITNDPLSAPEVLLDTNNPVKDVPGNITEPEKIQTEPLIPLEPYYTVDYFAAQGVKIQQNLLQDDKLGKQVKSFTDWLKTMKKVEKTTLHPPVEEKADTDVTIVSLAEKSLKNEDILTETMADVLIKQGKTLEAIRLFEKLSLQDTEKSSYFASRINDLKTN